MTINQCIIMKMMRFTIYVICFFMALTSNGQELINLYPNGILNTKNNVSLGFNVPEFHFYKPEAATGDKVFLIVPGGGYAVVAMGHEGHDVAKRLRENGYASFVLRYRLPDSTQMEDKRIGPIQDAQTALLYIREHAEELGLGGKEIVVLGFSAGGHLASTLSTHFETSYIGEVDKRLLRPGYSVLIYPVISMKDGITHQGSKMNLIGPVLDEEDVIRFSNELNINEYTPPTFLVHSDEDTAVPIKNVLLYKEGLDKYGIPNYFYRFTKGRHGFGMYNKDEEGDWFMEMLNWLNRF